MAGLFKSIKKIVFFNEPEKSEHFILKETKEEQDKQEQESNDKQDEQKSNEKLKKVQQSANHRAVNKEEEEKMNGDKGEEEKKESKPDISKKLELNLEYIKTAYSIPQNGDIMIREFDITFRKQAVSAFIVFFDGMTDRNVINNNILQPLMLFSNIDIKDDETDIAEYVSKRLLPQNQMKVAKNYRELMDEVNFGGCGIFVDGAEYAFAADVKGWEHRNIEKPTSELVIRGPQEAFNELLRSNSAQLRKRLMDENLISENIIVGKRSKTPCAMMYIKDIANDSLVNETRRRLKGLDVDYILDSGEIEQLIEDDSYFPGPQVLASERPDRIASMLKEGKVAIIVNGSPFVLAVPATAHELLHSPEDSYIKFPYANLLRLVRILAMFFTLLLPGIYIAITNYHQEMIPTDLLFAIEASREQVPFPSLVELLIMEIAFELIREAGIRIPGPIGPTLGIIGALILGQAAVAANIVSPILIIIVAVTGIGSFAIPNFSLGYSFRILRFGIIFLGAAAGFLGITAGLFLLGIWTSGIKSFGVPYFVPFGAKTAGGLSDEIFKAPVWKLENRADYLNTKNEKKQAKISMKWKRSR